jgi:hypothetical protein
VEEMTTTAHPRLNIYVGTPRLREHVRMAAARAQTSVSAYCEEAIRRRLIDDGEIEPTQDSARAAARELDRMRQRLGPIGVPVSELIAHGRRR